MADIILHKTKGVNPHLTFCPRCGGDGDEIVLVGARDVKETCRDCGTLVYGGISAREGCPKCKSKRGGERTRLKEHERLPGSLCKACVAEKAEHARLVAEGGVYWRCPHGHGGVLLAHAELAQQVRAHMKISAPEPCGVELTREQCPACK